MSAVDIDSIIVGDRMRAIDSEKVTTIAMSMKTIGLQTPITVCEDGHEVHLIAGRHRLAAAIQLGWEDIACNVVVMNDIDRKRWEIAENLHRAELTALERDQHIAEWIRLTEEAEVLAQSAPKPKSGPKGGRPESGTRKAARELGIDRDDARRAVKVSRLTDEANQVARRYGLDNNRSALLKASAEPPEKQAEKMQEIAKEKREKYYKLRIIEAPAPKTPKAKIKAALQAATSDINRASGHISEAHRLMDEHGVPNIRGLEVTKLRDEFQRLCAVLAAADPDTVEQARKILLGKA